MASVDVHTAVENLPLATATTNEEARQSTEPLKTAKPLEDAQASVVKDIAQMSMSDKTDTLQHSETQQGMSSKLQEEQLPLPPLGSKDLIRHSAQSENPHQDLKPSTQDVEKCNTSQLSLEQVPKPGNVTNQQLQSRDKPAKKSIPKGVDSDSSSSEDEHKKAKSEPKHTFGLSQAISSGFAGAAAGAASSLTGAATSAVLGAMHGKIGTPKPAPAQEAKKIEKIDSAKPSTEVSQGQQKAAKDNSTKHHHSHHHDHHHGHHSSHGDGPTHEHEDTKDSHHSHSTHNSSHDEHPEGSHHEHSHSHDGHSRSHHEHSHERHDHSKDPATQSSHESGHTHHHHSTSQYHR